MCILCLGPGARTAFLLSWNFILVKRDGFLKKRRLAHLSCGDGCYGNNKAGEEAAGLRGGFILCRCQGWFLTRWCLSRDLMEVRRWAMQMFEGRAVWGWEVKHIGVLEKKVRRTMIGGSTEQKQRWSQKGGAGKAGIIWGHLGDFRNFCSFSEWWYLIHVWKVLSGCWRGCRRQGWMQGDLLEVYHSNACEKWWSCTPW